MGLAETSDRAVDAPTNDETNASELYDQVINHLFGSALGLAGVVSRNRLHDEDKQRLEDVIVELDLAVRIIREMVFARVEKDLGIE